MSIGMRKQKLIKNIVFYFFLILIICVLDFPIYWMVKCSFTDVDQIMTRDVSLAMTELDPAAYVGDFETDLAMTELFGRFPPTFYRAYQEENPVDGGYQERKPIYQLYHLLNHLNLFGRSYLGSVAAILGAM